MNSSKRTFLILIAVFVTPIVLGTLFFFNMEKFGISRDSVNYGTLITPAFPAKVEGLVLSGKSAVFGETLSKKWTMLYIAPDKCDQSCLDRLLLIKRVRLLMNEQMRRVRTVVVTANEEANKSLMVATKKGNSDLVYAHLAADQTDNKTITSPFLNQFPHREKLPVYLLDPLGNLMMYYSQEDPDAKKMIRDMLRLLKYSRLG